MLQWKILSIPAMPQCKVMYSSQQLLRKIIPSMGEQINQSLLLMLKMETSQHNPYESESLSFMSTNELTMPQYKPFEPTMLQDKSKSIIDERAMPQNKSSSQKTTINERSVSQCKVSSRMTVSPIKTLSEMAMSQCRVIPQLSIHHKPNEEAN